jgi:glutathione-dependent peroxiredoxin
MSISQEVKRVPTVAFRIRHQHEWQTVTTDELFRGKTVVVFSLPGAFTPTCSASHLPRYNELAPVFFANGVDSILCVSVNDAFVMSEWGADQDADNITLIPDGNGEFTEGMGQLVDKTDLGFGKRSWRYSMLVKDGVVEKMFVEPHNPGDPFEVSDADTMLNYINPGAKKPDQVVVFTREGCTFCGQAKANLKDAGYAYVEIPLAHQIRGRVLGALTGAATVPQVFINGAYVGDAEALQAFLRRSS